jgi:uncharacterized protein (TIGR02001 family)
MKTMNLTTAVCAAALLAVSVPAFADDTGGFSFEGSVTLTTDYVFRGISQTQNDPAIQGDFKVSHDVGFFGSVWASNVDFDDGAEDTNLEVDFTVGFANDVANTPFSYEVGLIYYAYPDSDDDYNYWEGYFAPSYTFAMGGDREVELSGGVYYSPEFFGDTGDAWYLTAGLEVPVIDVLSASANIGWQTIDETTPDDYMDWNVGLTYGYEPWSMEFDVRYHDTDLDDVDCASFTASVNDVCDDRVVFSVGKSL